MERVFLEPVERVFSFRLKGHCHGGRTWKKSGWRFQVRILSSWWYHNDRTFFQLHYTGIVIFIKTGPVFVGFLCCKMCFCPLEFLKRCSWRCPFNRKGWGGTSSHVPSVIVFSIDSAVQKNRGPPMLTGFILPPRPFLVSEEPVDADKIFCIPDIVDNLHENLHIDLF